MYIFGTIRRKYCLLLYKVKCLNNIIKKNVLWVKFIRMC
nr:MAG TPA: hypothetical protein [Caudoviricetes sp.]